MAPRKQTPEQRAVTMQDYMGVIGNSSRACEKRKRKEFNRFVVLTSIRILVVAGLIALSTL